MLEVIQDESLKKLSNIQHGFFTRQGGVSTGIYESLNCAYASQDNSNHVRENRQRAMAHFGLSLGSLITVKNFHSNIVSVVESPWTELEKPKSDAMVTKLSNVMLGSDSADCPIVLFADENAGIIGLAHAGWRGAKNGIIEATVKKMMALGSEYNQISAAISPCIAQCSYEVSKDFYQQFLIDTQSNEKYFINSSKTDHFLFDLLAYVRDRLLNLKLKSVSTETTLDTYSNEKKFFSYRRALHKGEPCFGGHLSCIAKVL